MTYAADLHLHSSYAMATSPSITLESMASWAAVKGVDLLATADFTHPVWLAELKAKLEPLDDGLFALRAGAQAAARFVLGTEVSCVYAQGGRTRRLHLLVLAPDFAAVDRLCAALAPHGKLASDGRPTLRLSAREVVAAALGADARCEVIPAHAWTPWYSVYGSKGGFDSLAEAFGDMLPHVHAIETGLSSDPSMNWRVPELDGMSIVSFSDAHSPSRMGRELTVFEGEPSYDGLRAALADGAIAYTVEFHPEEGKYHYDGHRKCGVCQHPATTLQTGERCPVCGRAMTLGVLHRMEALSGRPAAVERGADGMLSDPSGLRPPFRRLVGLETVIAEAVGRGRATKGVREIFTRLVESVGNELHVLTEAPIEAVASIAGERVAEGVARSRAGDVAISPGYDGVYGTVRLWETERIMGEPSEGAPA
ncbi:MAG: DNA helicase UvrD [Chloroflexi bacterium]|nr:DNA helicase UvrD [Chloroflexota bacterium]